MAEARRAALWSPEALNDRGKIWDYYVRAAGRHTAEKVLREIAEMIALIEDHAFAGRTRNEVGPGLRSFAATPHVVFYRVVNDTPEIARVLVESEHFNGHPDLLVQGRYPNNSVAAGTDGVEIKSTRKRGGAVDTHGARDQWMCVFVYKADHDTEPAVDREPMKFTEIYLAEVKVADFRNNPRGGNIGTHTSTLSGTGIKKLRSNWIYIAK